MAIDPDVQTKLDELESRLQLQLDDHGQRLAALEAEAEPEPAPLPEPIPAIRGEVSIRLTFDHFQIVANEQEGTDVGDYVGEFVHEQCREIWYDQHNLRIYFRRDADGPHRSIIVENFRLWDSDSEPGTVGNKVASDHNYTAEIFVDGELVHTEEIDHRYGTRWRWQNFQRPVVRDRDELLHRQWVFPFRYDLLNHSTTEPAQPQKHVRFGAHGLNTKMGTAGERPDLGVFTEWQAFYLAHPNGDAWESVIRNQAETGSGYIPWVSRDETTGAPLDFTQLPVLLGNHWGHRNQPLYYVPATATDAGWKLSHEHTPSYSYLAWALTDDPYFIEGMSFQLSSHMGWNAYHRNRSKVGTLFYPSSERGFAWAMRTTFNLILASPENPPSWLLPKSYWQTASETNRQYCESLIARGDDYRETFRALIRPSFHGPWQQDYFLHSIAHGIRLGTAEDWREIFKWCLPNLLARTNGNSGWCRDHAPIYYLRYLDESDAPKSWQEAHELLYPDYVCTDQWQGASPGYFDYEIGCLGAAALIGELADDEPLIWALGQRRNSSTPSYLKWLTVPERY